MISKKSNNGAFKAFSQATIFTVGEDIGLKGQSVAYKWMWKMV